MLTGLLLLIVQQNTGKYSKVKYSKVLLFNNLLIKITTFIDAILSLGTKMFQILPNHKDTCNILSALGQIVWKGQG